MDSKRLVTRRATIVRRAVEGLEPRRLFSTLSGVVYKDVNFDGVRNTGDTTLSGVAVQVYTGANSNSLTLFRTLTTDGSGVYLATDLPDSGYAMVRPISPSGYVWADVSALSFYPSSTYVTRQDFLQTDKSVYRGYVFSDANGNGVWDSPGESLSGAGTRGYLDVNNNQAYDAGEPSAVTDGSGIFYIGGINPGSYAARIVPTAGYVRTAPAVDGAVAVSFSSTPTNTNTRAFGIQNTLPTSTIAGYSFNDANGNGRYDTGDTANAGRTVFIDKNYNARPDTGEVSAVTNTSGYFELKVRNPSTGPASYDVSEALPVDYTQTTPVGGKVTATVAPGQTAYLGQAFGSLTQQYVISGIVFTDADGRGVFDNGVDAPVAGRTIYVDSDYDGRFNAGEPSTVSGGDGRYTITLTAPGNYAIGQVVPDGLKMARPPNTGTTSPYAFLTTTNTKATLDFGSRPIGNSLTVDGPAWVAPAVTDVEPRSVIFLAGGGWLTLSTQYYGRGYHHDLIKRYKPDGTADTAFGVAGTLTADPGEATNVLELPDGKLIVAGSTFGGQYGIVRRYHANGTLDTSYGTSGVVNNYTGLSKPTFVNALTLAANGDLLLSAVTQTDTPNRYDGVATLTRLNAAGVRQTSFGTNGNYFDNGVTQFGTGVTSVAATPDGGAVFKTYYNRLLKVTAAGRLDSTFATNGVLALTHGNDYMSMGAVRVLTNGSLLFTGQAKNTALLARFTAAGTPDLAFGDNGYALAPAPVTWSGVITVDSYATALPLPGGGYLAVGNGPGSTIASDLLVTRFADDGTIDPAFYTAGRGTFAVSTANDSGQNAALSPDGRVLIGVRTLDSNSVGVVRLPDAGVITGRIYVDANANNSYDAGDTPQMEFAYLDLNKTGKVDAGDRSALADRATGLYRFDNVPAGTYAVLFNQPSLSPPMTQTVTVVGQQRATADFAIPFYGTLGGFAFNDADKDGVYDAARGDTALTSGSVFLDANDNGTLDSGEVSRTLTTGNYGFGFLVAGTYRPRLALPAGATATTTPIVTLAPGQHAGGIDLGLSTPATDPASVTREAEDAVLTGGAHFENTNPGFTGTGYADYDVSGSAARFDITRVNAGQVSLTFRYANGGTADRPLAITVNGMAAGSLSFPPTGNWTTWKTVTINVTLAAGANTIVATAGAASGANVDSLTIAAAEIPPALGTLSGFAFDDTDKDGVYDSTEKKTAGKTVFLDLDNDGVLDTNEKKVTTASDGTWSFTGLAAGSYRVRRVFPSGYTQSTPPIDVTLAAGQTVDGLAIGSKSATVTPPTTHTASITGSVFSDNNKNGKYDSGDGYAKGVIVFLDTDNDGKLDTGETSVTTDNSGKFGFTKLAAGTYRVRRVMPSGYAYSTTKPDVTLAKGQAKSGVLIGTKKV